ncbi:hypothetical protein F503_05660 [Ophiostoma piceae UAMH 11346]|uniref:Uncharacterized protein n=1 Tax=Ophiostoma piceae (strain UAMH 11346) TaxID=1262450 RepID=S3DAJ9_OPHP1|nr:hypothetical protein F503_05660 [Ophiostoma piceae UAMH 11346]
MNTIPILDPMVHMPLDSDIFEATAHHRRTVFLLATPGGDRHELKMMLQTPLWDSLRISPSFTIRDRDPDVKFVQLFPTQRQDLPATASKTSWWYSDAHLAWFDNGFFCSQVPNIAVLIQAVIDVVLKEKTDHGIPFANMVIGGIGQAGVVAMGVVLACGVEGIRYISVDAGVPLLTRMQPLLQLIKDQNANSQLAMFSLAIFFRANLGLTVPNQHLGNDTTTKMKGGLISMLFHPSIGTNLDKDSRIRAQQSLKVAGYNVRLGIGQTPRHSSYYGDNVNTLYNSIVDSLKWMDLDDSNLDPLGGG